MGGFENITHRVAEGKSILETIKRYEFSGGIKRTPEIS